MGLGSELDPGYLVAILSLLGKDNKREKVLVVEQPASAENVEDVEDWIDSVSSHCLCLGDTRSNLAPSVVTYRGTRQRGGKSRGGKCGSLQHTSGKPLICFLLLLLLLLFFVCEKSKNLESTDYLWQANPFTFHVLFYYCSTFLHSSILFHAI